MGSSTTGTIIGIIVGLLVTLGIGYLLCFAAISGFPLSGPGLISPTVISDFQTASIIGQIQLIYSGILLNILETYIVAPVIWLLGGLIAGLVVRDMMKGAAAGLIAAIIAPFICWILTWSILYPGDFTQLANPTLLNLLLNWVIHGILGGIIAAVGGVIGGTLTSGFEAR
ncbi:MAG: DUF5518 domain-containing protein [Candidatus Thorarchaeota archaeon]